MKTLRYKSIELLSEKDQRGRRIDFHPNSNLILGMNHVGKSTLTKQLLEVLGATPKGRLEGWDSATIILLTLSIEDEDYLILRHQNHRAFFDNRGELLYATSRLSEWSGFFNVFVGFNLVLSDKSEKTTQGDAACMLLPFYINQDGGWSGTWHTFEGLGRFKDSTRSVLEYFTQLVPPKYYVAKSEAENEQRLIVTLEADLRILNRARERFVRSINSVSPQLSAAGFEVEIDEISKQLTQLNAQQESYRVESVGLQEDLASVDYQIALTTDTLKRFGKDFEFLSSPKKEDLTCPTCGAHHEESFLAVLSFAEDGRVLADMLIRLREDRRKLTLRIHECGEKRASLSGTYNQLQELLDVKRGELHFRDVVQSMGSGLALRSFESEDRELNDELGKHLARKQRLEEEMKAFRDRKRRTAIQTFFQSHYAAARRTLNLDEKDTSKFQVTKRPDVSGSGGPREVLAYYAALWWTSHESAFGSPFSIPVIVDCPAQSGQDAVNLPAMLHFLSVGLPPGVQAIVTHESDVPEAFDRRIELTRARSLLEEGEFARVADSVLPKLQALQRYLLQQA